MAARVLRGPPTLEDAVKAYGFLLAPISAQAFADVGVDPRAPETAVVEALRRSFAEADFPDRSRAPAHPAPKGPADGR